VPRPLAERIAEHAARAPGGLAIATADARMSWAEYYDRSTGFAQHLVSLGFAAGERVGVLLPDGPGVHAALLGCEKAGLVAVGIGPRAGYREIEHLLRKSGAVGFVSRPVHQGRRVADFLADLELRHHVAVEGELDDRSAGRRSLRGRRIGAGDVFLLNSTSGTSGLPKIVVHDQRRWLAFHELAVESGDLTSKDVFMSVVPAPFGFGLWTSHVTPAILGVPTVVTPRFSAAETLAQIEEHRVTVLAAVSTQFVMLLESDEMEKRDLSSLRVLYTGGEIVPYARAAEFEDRTGAAVLQFYGSNETGAVSGTSLRDDREKRLRTSGKVIPAMHVRLFDEGTTSRRADADSPAARGPP
jgi:acyl-CoA synthetase